MSSFNSMKVGTKLGLMLVGYVICSLFLAVWTYTVFEKAKVNGPIYEKIVSGKDLIADILPPPEFLVESYLTVYQIGDAIPTERKILIDRLKTLKNEYNVRFAFWGGQELDPSVRAVFDETHKSAEDFYRIAIDQYVPAIDHNESAKATVAFDKLKDLYASHRAGIVQMAELIAKHNEAQEADAASVISTSLWVTGGIQLAFAVFGIIFIMIVSRSITHALGGEPGEAIEVATNIADGKFNSKIDTSSASSGSLIYALNQMQITLRNIINDVGSVMGGVAEGNLSGTVTAAAKGDLDTLKQSVNTGVQSLADTMRIVTVNTRQVATATSQTSSAIGQISDGAQNQMHAISQVATAVSETAKGVVEVSENTENASEKARDSMNIVQEGRGKMDNMVRIVSNIAANSEKINKITEVIEKIANKTNLLSLNAAIEAARAGEHGKGFAVVAEEVGKLAASSAEQTKEITGLVSQAVNEAGEAMRSVQEVSADMIKIEESSMQTEGMLQRISAAMEQQSAAVQEINANINNLNQIAQANAAASEEITATVVELAQIAGETRSAVEKFSV